MHKRGRKAEKVSSGTTRQNLILFKYSVEDYGASFFLTFKRNYRKKLKGINELLEN